MTTMRKTNKKLFAGFFLIAMGLQTFYPGAAYALTSGPSQPEMQKFTPAGTNDMVDLFSGDFNNNIPLLDVGGYPVNIAYHSGTGMEEEATWVGMGWNLNPGAVNRNMRGLPDDFNGDLVKKTTSHKEFKKVGAEVVIKPSIVSWETGSASLKMNVYKDNYYGFGASVGSSIGQQLAKNSKTSLTAALSLDIDSDTRNGVSVSPSLSLQKENTENKELAFGGLTGGFKYNTRAGLKSYSLGISFNSTETDKIERRSGLQLNGPSASFEHLFGQTYTPSISSNSLNTQFTFGLDGGITFWGLYFGLGGEGYVYKEHLVDGEVPVKSYGYMNYLAGRKNQNALLDFNREKDGVFLPSAPAIAIPVATHDYFTATGQTGSQQFRPHFGGNYVVFDALHNNLSLSVEGGITVGGGNLIKGGARLSASASNSETKKWVKNNNYLTRAEPDFTGGTPVDEPVYIKQVGEHIRVDQSYLGLIGNEETKQVAINDRMFSYRDAYAFAAFKSRESGRTVIGSDIKKVGREKRNTIFSFQTGRQAALNGLDKNIKSYASPTAAPTLISRTAGTHKPHHISEIKITDNEGKRMVYGIPVYNNDQQDVTFSVAPPLNMEMARRNGLIDFTTNGNVDGPNNKGRDNFYSKEQVPAYATSFLLTGILSPDYVDVKNDGITDDDLGTAIKFNYSKTASDFKWRAPFELNKANYNEGMLSDPKDDKASYVYGNKELWFLQSIESKTMIAIFETSVREDGLGVTGKNGGANTAIRQRKLDRIKLYSKADWLQNPATAVPIKTVNFEYDYSLYPGVPNNTGAVVNDPKYPGVDLNEFKGKLTLKKIYFTFGSSRRGETNPYEFYYDMRPIHDGSIENLPAISDGTDPEANDLYAPRQDDRWGSYKQSFYNRVSGGSRVLNNSEFPYALQDDDNTPYDDHILADRFASKWQLNQIITPTGSIINIEYESDDYAYVQNRRAMQMCFVTGVQTAGVANGMIEAKQFTVALPKKVLSEGELPVPIPGYDKQKEFRRQYLEGQDKIFYKILTDLDASGHYEYVYGYASIEIADCKVDATGKVATIVVKPMTPSDKNPVSRSAWQQLRTDLPQYAYDNYDNSDVGDAEGAIRSIVQALKNFGELVRPFDEKARRRKFGDKIDLSKSMVRLLSPLGKKLGGGSRVHKITISDQWETMTNIPGVRSASYGQVYNYSTTDAHGNTISSGVAAYEPQIGNEENPFHEPVNFTEKVHWSSDKYHFVEKPFGESYFPAASVGYSKVTVTSIGNREENETGYIENEFYTAKDFPTLVDYMPLDYKDASNSLTLTLFASVSIRHAAAAQGFKVETNDMHGKPKSVKVFNRGKELLSSTEYFYSVKDENAEAKELDNYVSVLEANGNVTAKNPSVPNSGALIATDIDFTSDVRESNNESYGGSVGAYAGTMILPIPFFPFPVPYMSYTANMQVNVDTYNAVSTVKVIHKFGIIKKIRTTQNGSTITAENMLYDGETGEVLLTKTQNEFNDYTYAFNYPAYMAYEGMGGAYKNAGATFASFITTTDGRISPALTPYLFPGDELVSDFGVQRGWVIKSLQDGTLRFIDRKGDFISNNVFPYRIDRSGRRNMMTAAAGSVVCMNNPIVGGHIVLGVDQKILDSKAALFKDEWSVPVAPGFGNYQNCGETSGAKFGEPVTYDTTYNIQIEDGKPSVSKTVVPAAAPTGASCVCSCLKGLFDYLISSHHLFILESQNITVGQLVAAANANGFPVTSCPVIDNNYDKLFYALTSGETAGVYTAHVGDCKVSINSTNGSAINFYSLKSDACNGGDNVTYSSGSSTQTVSQSFSTTCSQNSVFASGGFNEINSAPRLVAADFTANGSQFFMTSNFKIPGVSSIPANATILSAQLYLYSYSAGFNPPTYPNAHTTSAETNGEHCFFLARVASSWDCISHINWWYGSQTATVTNHFQDFVINFSSLVQDARVYGNFGFGLIGHNVLNTPSYASFTSENETNPARRPHLDVVYTIPGIGTTPNAAYLQVDECNSCPDPVNRKINPYFAGVLGNWRPQTSYVYTVNRAQAPGLATQNGGTDIRRNGYYTDYTAFWTFGTNGLINAFNVAPALPYATTDSRSRWVWSNKSVYYDQKGNELESVDALNRFGSALFGYKQSVAVAVAANARHNEIAFDGFEDYRFDLQPAVTDACPIQRQLDFGIVKQSGNWVGQNGSLITSEQVHTGRYSYKLNGSTLITKLAGAALPTTPVLAGDAIGKYLLKANELALGYGPIANKNQLMSLWVYDGSASTNKITTLQVKINGVDQHIENKVVPVVEGWKKLDLSFIAASPNFSLELIPSGVIYIDDIRLMPFDAQMNSYVYDDRNMRLMGQLDENNFATLYEYDEEGTPVRVKKETERGIMTLKENRQSFRKR